MDTTQGDGIDLGLPSGLLWATRNVGAATPSDYGDYFAWGETEPKDVYIKDTYRHYDSDKGWTKYNDEDGLTTLQSEDDAAATHYGGRTPTTDEWEELYENTKTEWITINGVSGRRFIGPNGNSLFLPAASLRYSSETGLLGSYGLYWTATLFRGSTADAWRFRFNGDGVDWLANSHRYNGLPLRAVRSAR